MRGDRNHRRDNRVTSQKRREEKTIKTGRPRVRRRGVICDMKEGMGVVRRIKQVKLGFESGPQLQKGGRRRRESSGGSVSERFNEVQIPSEKSSHMGIGSGHSSNKLGVERILTTGLKINIETAEKGGGPL